MQTFLPYPDYAESARCLDDRRLNKQTVEVYQILHALQQGPYQQLMELPDMSLTWCSCEESYYKQLLKGSRRLTPWYNHPATQMWLGYSDSLVVYGLRCCIEWKKRGKNSTMFNKIMSFTSETWKQTDLYVPPTPPFIGCEAFHDSHKSNLLRKSPTYYSQFGWTVPNNLPYVWPTKQSSA